MPDGRLLVTNKGRERFKVLDIVHSKPIMVCKVEVLPEEGDEELTEVGEKGKEGDGEVSFCHISKGGLRRCHAYKHTTRSWHLPCLLLLLVHACMLHLRLRSWLQRCRTF